jgi:S-adenosylmethionine-diacylgycerolhomoserine-N-methlytransferase
MLRPGGVIGVVDFYVSRKFPAPGRARHSWSTRQLWRWWFEFDNVYLSPDHLPFLASVFEPAHISEHRGRVPYLPFVRAPYYRFVGIRR